MILQSTGANALSRRNSRLVAMLLAGTTLAAMPAHAQTTPPSAPAQPTTATPAPAPAQADVIVVSGIRQTLQGSISTKKLSTQIVDALAAEEIGDLPALSIGEALETLTGAASHREQGGATEISIRGLGPFLSRTVVNGRAASNGSGDRSVNFSQFPSELFNKIGIFKTQSAEMIEGGVAGQITLETARPIDYGKRRLQGEFKLNYNPDNFEIDEDQRFNDLGYRASVSYVDQFRLGDGEVGFSIGYSRRKSTNPEQESASSNTLNYCRNEPSQAGTGVFDDGNCNTTRPTMAGTEDFVIARNSYSYRQNITDDTRDAVFGAVQLQPSTDVDINLDFQYSKRKFRERRNDLNFSEGRRVDGVGDGNRLDFDLIVGPDNQLQQFTNETRLETNSEYLERDEEYYGGGLSIEVQATDRLTLTADASYSQTRRIEEATQVRLRIGDDTDIFGNTGVYPDVVESDGSTNDDRVEAAIRVRQDGSDIVNFVVQDFDVNNYDFFSDDARVRYDLEQDRFNAITSARGDFKYELDGFIRAIKGGFRFQQLEYESTPGAAGPTRIQASYSRNGGAIAIANQACRTAFPESGFLDRVSNGVPLVTNVDAAGNVIGTTNTFATFDALCLARSLEENDPTGLITFGDNGLPIYPSGNVDTIQNTDVLEKSYAAYLQADYDADLGDIPVRGNFGLRVVKTKVLSRGFRGTLTATPGPDGEGFIITPNNNSLVPISARNSYTDYLPSFNFVADVAPNVLVRAAVYRALSRPDPSDLGFGRTFSATTDEDAESIADIIGSATASGNPNTESLLSWNYDVAAEWYPDKDSILAVGAYYKTFNGGFETVGQFETFTVSGQDFQALVTTTNVNNDTSTIYGFEVTAAHRFSYLPKPLDGLGFKLSYNYADSDFEFQDDTLGAITTINQDGSTTTSEALIPPANIAGLSKHVLSAQAYYEIGPVELQGIYKYRSRYFQPFIATPGRIRYVGETGVFEARASFKLNRNIRLSVEALNIFSEPRVDSRGTVDGYGQVLSFGPRYFFGIRGKF